MIMRTHLPIMATAILFANWVTFCHGNVMLSADSSMRTFRSDITCWTCPPHSDNEACNSWAPNLPCPLNDTVCQTVHIVDTLVGTSISVQKSCVHPSKCTSSHVGCTDREDKSKRCVSCCTDTLCNEDIPTDTQSAINLSTVPSLASSSATYNLLAISLSLLTGTVMNR